MRSQRQCEFDLHTVAGTSRDLGSDPQQQVWIRRDGVWRLDDSLELDQDTVQLRVSSKYISGPGPSQLEVRVTTVLMSTLCGTGLTASPVSQSSHSYAARIRIHASCN